MNTPEESQAEDRRRRTERQREKRERERVCGYCRKPATAGLIEWFGRARPLLIPICLGCLARLGASWRDMDEVGLRCPLDERRPCADCSVSTKTGREPGGLLRWLFSG